MKYFVKGIDDIPIAYATRGFTYPHQQLLIEKDTALEVD
jgi:hypothetical protein